MYIDLAEHQTAPQTVLSEQRLMGYILRRRRLSHLFDERLWTVLPMMKAWPAYWESLIASGLDKTTIHVPGWSFAQFHNPICSQERQEPSKPRLLSKRLHIN